MSATLTSHTIVSETRCAGADRILGAARTLFAQRGLSGVSMQQIADAAAVSKANVFHHFSSKQTLYRAVLEAAADEFRALLATLRQQTTAQGRQDFSLQHLTQMLNDPATTWLFLRALSDPQAGAQRHQAEEVVGEAMRAVIDAIGGLRAASVLPANAGAGTLALTLLGTNLIYFQLQNVLPRLDDHPELQDPATFAASVVHLLTPARAPVVADTKKANAPWE